MFPRSNAEHIPSSEGGRGCREKKRSGGGGGVEEDIKDGLIFGAIYWLVLSLPPHYIMSTIVNKQLTTAPTRERRPPPEISP